MATNFSMALPFRPYDVENKWNLHFYDYNKMWSDYKSTLVTCPTDDGTGVVVWGDWNTFSAARSGWEFSEAGIGLMPDLNCTEEALEYDGNTQSWHQGNGAIPEVPSTRYCKFKVSNVTQKACIHATSVAGNGNEHLGIWFRGDVSGDYLEIQSNSGGTNTTKSGATTSIVADTWYVACLVVRSATERELYIDGVSEIVDTVSSTASGHNIETTGGDWAGTWTDQLTGFIQECRIYDVAHTDAQVLACSTEVSNAPQTMNTPT
jgi:hypothetical protein